VPGIPAQTVLCGRDRTAGIFKKLAGRMSGMDRFILHGVFIIFGFFLLAAGCTQPALQDPVVTVGDISLADVSLKAMTVNTTINVFNPNPIGADLKNVTFDVWYIDDAEHYLGHGERSGISIKENGNTSMTIPVRIGTIQAAQGTASLVRKGSITIRVNGSAFIDLKLITYEKKFAQTEVFQAGEFTGLIPESFNVTDKLGQAQDILSAFTQ
jgi:LEA14-like dessication related protein